MKSFILTVVFIVLNHLQLVAQKETLAEKLSFMIGEWRGTGWMMTQTGKQFSDVSESVNAKLDGSILVVAGNGTKYDSIAKKSIVVHDAFGVISSDPLTGKIWMKAYKKESNTETEIEVVDEKKVRWILQIPGGRQMRFTTDYSILNTWKTTGEYSVNGENWIKIMENELKKVGL